MKKRILLVEDDIDARHLLKKILTNAGYDVCDFCNGSALVNQSSVEADLFILDNTMPTIDGIALTKYLKIKKETRSVPVLIVSGNPGISKKAVDAGASAFLPKPFQTSCLLNLVHRLIEGNMLQEPILLLDTTQQARAR